MKKQILAMMMILALVFVTAGCGKSKTQSSADDQQEQMRIGLKELTKDQQHILNMTGVEDDYSTGLMEYKGNERIKSLTVKIMEYRAGAKKWDCIKESQQEAGESGEIMISYSKDGSRVHCAFSSDPDEVITREIEGVKKIPENEYAMISSEESTDTVLRLNKDIVLQMFVQSKSGKDTMASPDIEAYPDTKAFKDYQYARAIVVNFSDKSLDEK